MHWTGCSPVALCEAVAAETRVSLQEEYGNAPPIEVVGDVNATFSFLPSHLRFVFGTLIRNSCVATLRRHHRRQAASDIEAIAPVPPVRVVIQVSTRAPPLRCCGAAPLARHWHATGALRSRHGCTAVRRHGDPAVRPPATRVLPCR